MTAAAALLEGRTVVVTGAGGGVGRGIALACATHGASVVIAARRTETGDVVAAEIAARGGEARSMRCDVTDRTDVDAAVDLAVSEFGALDVMVHNALAPVGDPRAIEEVPDDTWQAMLGTAVRASYLCAHAAYPHLERAAGITDPADVGRRRRGQPLPPRLRRGQGRAARAGQEPGPRMGPRRACGSTASGPSP